jgi:hypothetical protein
MKVKSPRPINLKGTRKEAVLLLHIDNHLRHHSTNREQYTA